MKGELHWSHMATLFKCGEAFRFAYIEGRRVRPGIAIATGSAVHDVAARNLRSKAEFGELLPIAAIRDHARDAWERAAGEGIELLPEERERGAAQGEGEAIDRTIRLSVAHARELAPAIRPKAGGIERAWRIAVDGFPFELAGEIDVQEARDGELPSSIRDLKTSGKMPSAQIAGDSGQLTMYAIAAQALDQEFPDLVALDYCIDGGTGSRIGTFVSERRPEHVAAFWARLEQTAEIIEKQVFTPADPQTSWWCSPRWCGYARINPDTGHPYCRYYASAPVSSSGATFTASTNPNSGERTNGSTRKRSSKTIESAADRAAIIAGL